MTYTTHTDPKLGGDVRNFASLYEDLALEQALMISRGQVTLGPVIMLPDAHAGRGACVGTAIQTLGGIYPAAIGVDIGCGMIAVKTSLRGSDLDIHKRRIVRGNIEKYVPSGVGTSRQEVLPHWLDFVEQYGLPPVIKDPIYDEIFHRTTREAMADKAAIQFGTLGSGNHFIELSVDVDDSLWAIVHSGSRGVGNELASGFIRRAYEDNTAEGIELEHRDVAFLRSGTPAFDSYIKNMLWAQAYAFYQREAMMDLVLLAVTEVAGGFERELVVNCHHNYSELVEFNEETGWEVWLSRKGAIDANKGVLGVVPGSMGTDSYIVSGLGNPDSYFTSPHGAGRVMARGKPEKKKADGTIKPATGAWANLDVEDFKRQMDERGVVWQDRSAFNLLDEAPGTYKPIETVLNDSREIIEPIYRLVQIVNYKGE